MNKEFHLEVYSTNKGKFPFIQWESQLPDATRAAISARLARLRQGNLGDCKPITGRGAKGLYELRIRFGSGYRIYFGVTGKNIIIIHADENKKSQDKDITKIKDFWNDYLDSLEGDNHEKI